MMRGWGVSPPDLTLPKDANLLYEVDESLCGGKVSLVSGSLTQPAKDR